MVPKLKLKWYLAGSLFAANGKLPKIFFLVFDNYILGPTDIVFPKLVQDDY